MKRYALSAAVVFFLLLSARPLCSQPAISAVALMDCMGRHETDPAVVDFVRNLGRLDSVRCGDHFQELLYQWGTIEFGRDGIVSIIGIKVSNYPGTLPLGLSSNVTRMDIERQFPGGRFNEGKNHYTLPNPDGGAYFGEQDHLVLVYFWAPVGMCLTRELLFEGIEPATLKKGAQEPAAAFQQRMAIAEDTLVRRLSRTKALMAQEAEKEKRVVDVPLSAYPKASYTYDVDARIFKLRLHGWNFPIFFRIPEGEEKNFFTHLPTARILMVREIRGDNCTMKRERPVVLLYSDQVLPLEENYVEPTEEDELGFDEWEAEEWDGEEFEADE